MLPILTPILAALAPSVIDIVKSVSLKIFGLDAEAPKSVEERISLMKAETGKLEALAKLDAVSGEVSKWVSNLRGSYRYIAATIILFYTGYISTTASTNPTLPAFLELSSAVVFWLFGEKVLLKVKGIK